MRYNPIFLSITKSEELGLRFVSSQYQLARLGVIRHEWHRVRVRQLLPPQPEWWAWQDYMVSQSHGTSNGINEFYRLYRSTLDGTA